MHLLVRGPKVGLTLKEDNDRPYLVNQFRLQTINSAIKKEIKTHL